MAERTEYLADGLYVEIDHGMIRLFTDRGGITHEVFLDHTTLQAFFNYIRKVSAGVS